MNKPESLSSRERSARWRARMRERGYRPKTIWVPDLRRPEVRADLQREVQAIRIADRESDEIAFWDSIGILHDLPPYEAPLRDEE